MVVVNVDIVSITCASFVLLVISTFYLFIFFREDPCILQIQFTFALMKLQELHAGLSTGTIFTLLQ